MVDAIVDNTPRSVRRLTEELTASPQSAFLLRQTYALECILRQVGALCSHIDLPAEMPVQRQPQYELAIRRLLQEAV